jgi:hypothetical protein
LVRILTTESTLRDTVYNVPESRTAIYGGGTDFLGLNVVIGVTGRVCCERIKLNEPQANACGGSAVFGRSLAGIVGSNPTGGMDVCFL